MASSSHRQPFSSKIPKLESLTLPCHPPPPPPPPQSFPPKNSISTVVSSVKNPNSTAVASRKSPKLAAAGTADAGDKGKSVVTLSLEDVHLSNSSHLTREEVLRRRSHNVKQLAKQYREHYWGLMEEVKVQYRDYVWRYGKSPYKEDNDEGENAKDAGDDAVLEGSGETNANGNPGINNVNASNNGSGNLLCAFYGCKLKAMALTSFCHLHILSDPKQKLYKPCDYVIQSAQAGPITCGKPILQSSVPSLCNIHIQKAQKHLTRALRQTGLNVSSSSKIAPKFHVLLAEFVREIQSKRKVALKASKKKRLAKHERGS